MANEVKLTIRVSDDGSLNVVAKEAKKASKATEELGASTRKTSKARSNYHKGEKGVAGATANSTKAFSKMNQTMSGSSGLVAAYASLAANVFALTAVFGTLRRAAQVEQLTIGMSELGKSSGLAMQSLSRGLVSATGNAISFADAMRSVATVTSAGLDPSTINRFGEAAKNISIVLGRDVSDSFDRLSRGVTKLEPELLDELGLFIRVDEASQKFAQSIGKSAGDLTNFEKRLAFANETLDQAERKFGSLDASVSSNPYSILAASFADLSDELLKFVNKALLPVIELLSRSPEALIGVIGLLGGRVIGGAVASLVRFEGALEVSTKAQQKAATAAAAIAPKLNITSKLMTNYGEALKKGSANIEGFKKAQQGAAQSLATNERLLNRKTITLETYNTRVKNTNQVLTVFAIAQSQVQVATGKTTLALAIQAIQLGELSMAAGLAYLGMLELGSGIGLAAKGMLTASTFTGFFTAALATLRAVAGSTIAIVAALGAAVAIALPLISLVVLAATLGGDAIEYFKRAMRTDAENELIDRLKEVNTTFDELQANIQETNLALDGQSSKITTVGDRYQALFNILSTVRSEYGRLDAVGQGSFTDSQRVELLNKAFSQSKVLQEALSKEYGTQVKGLDELKVTDSERVEIAERILERIYSQTSAIAGLKEATEGLTEESKNFISSLQPKTSVTAITAQFNNMVKSIERAEEEGENLEDAITTVFERLSKEDRDILGISNIVDSSQKAQQEFDKLQAATIAAQAKFNAAVRAGAPAVQQMELYTAYSNTQKQMEAAKRVVEETTSAESAMKANLFEIIRARSENFNTQEDSLIAAKRNQAALASELETLKEIGVISEENIRAQIKTRNELNNAKIAEGRAEIGVLETIKNQQKEGSELRLALEARIREITADVATLQEKITEGAEIDVEVAQTKLSALQQIQKAEKAILAEQQRQLAATNARQRALQNIKRSVLEVNAARQGRSVTASEEAAFAEQNLKATVEAEVQKNALKKQQIDLEYDLLAAQFELLEAEIKLAKEKGTIGASTADELISSINDIETGLGEARKLAKGAADAETASAIVKAVADGQIKSFNAARELTAQKEALLEKEIENIKQAGRIEAGLRKENALLAAQEAQLRTDLSNETDEIARLEFQNQLEENLTQQVKNRIALRAEEAQRAQELGGGFAGAATSFVGTLQNQREEGGVFAEGSDATLSEKIQKLREGAQGLMQELAALGPDGVLVSAIAQGSFVIAESLTAAFDNSAKGMEGAANKAQAIADTIGAVNSIMQAGIQATIAKIDDQIKAEKKRDGKSAESVAKIQALEKKKEAQQRKAFETNKKMLMAQTVANTAAGIMRAIAEGGIAGIVIGGIIAAMGAAQLAIIASQTYQGGSTSAPQSPSSISLGERKGSVDLARSQSARGELAYFRGESGTGGPENFKNAFAGYKNRAEGGNTAYMVGEQGPELFVPEMPGRIVPNDDIAASGPTNVSFNINTVDATGVEDLLVAQRGNIIGMIRQAANSYGQDFVEDVDTSVFTQSAGGVSKY